MLTYVHCTLYTTCISKTCKSKFFGVTPDKQLLMHLIWLYDVTSNLTETNTVLLVFPVGRPWDPWTWCSPHGTSKGRAGRPRRSRIGWREGIPWRDRACGKTRIRWTKGNYRLDTIYFLQNEDFSLNLSIYWEKCVSLLAINSSQIQELSVWIKKKSRAFME